MNGFEEARNDANGEPTCWHGDTNCRYDHRTCTGCAKEYADCTCHLDDEYAESARAQMRVVGNDGLTDSERAMYAERWLRGPGRMPTATEAAELKRLWEERLDWARTASPAESEARQRREIAAWAADAARKLRQES